MKLPGYHQNPHQARINADGGFLHGFLKKLSAKAGIDIRILSADKIHHLSLFYTRQGNVGFCRFNNF